MFININISNFMKKSSGWCMWVCFLRLITIPIKISNKILCYLELVKKIKGHLRSDKEEPN